jgi:hypothetical protein
MGLCFRGHMMETMSGHPDMETQAAADARTKANAERFEAIARIFDSSKTSRCELILDGLNIDGDPLEPFAAIADRLRGVEQPPSTDHWPAHLRALLDIAHTLDAALQSMLDEDDGGHAAGPARADLEQARLWFSRAAYERDGVSAGPETSGNGSTSEKRLEEPQFSVSMYGSAAAAAAAAAKAEHVSSLYSPDKDVIMQTLAMTGWREGSRAIGHDGPERGEWEDYVEVPIETMKRLVRLVKADIAYDQAQATYSELKLAKGAWHVNELSHTHPATISLRQAGGERAEALASFRAAAQEPAS